jgi:hypothetical protein
VDGDQCGEDQDRRAGERILKRLRAALEALLNRGRTIWLSLGITGNPASVSSRFNAPRPLAAARDQFGPSSNDGSRLRKNG